MIEWQSVSRSEGNHIAATVPSVLEILLDTINLLLPRLEMLYLIVLLRFSERTLRL
jgi:hypothetical protein